MGVNRLLKDNFQYICYHFDVLEVTLYDLSECGDELSVLLSDLSVSRDDLSVSLDDFRMSVMLERCFFMGKYY